MTTRDYVFRLRGEADQLVQAHERAAAAVDKHADETADLVRQQAAARTAGDNYIASLKRQADGIGKSRTEMLALQAAELGVSERAAPLIARLQQGERQFGNFARSGKLSALELQQVGFQLNDLAVQVASGQNPITALVQQGSQLTGTFGGIRPAISALASLVTPAVVGVAALAAGAGALALGYSEAAAENKKINDAIELTGNFAGRTRGEVEALAQSVSALSKVSTGDARDAVAATVGSGRFGPQAVESVSRTVANLQRITGAAAEDVVKQLSRLGERPAQAAAELNRQYNFLTPKIYDQVRALEAQGRVQEAAALVATTLNSKLDAQAKSVFALERAYIEAKKAVTGFFDRNVVALFRDSTADDSLAKVQKRIQEIRAIQRGGQLFVPLIGESFNVNKQLAEYETLEAKLIESRDLARGVAQARAKDAEETQEKIRNQGPEAQAALAALERAGAAQRLAFAESAQERDLALLQSSFDRNVVTAQDYVAKRVLIERQLIAAKERALDEEIAIERRRPVETKPDTIQQQAKLVELETRRIGIQRERAALAERARRGELRPSEDRRNAIGDAEAGFARRVEEFAARNQAALDRAQEQARRGAEDLLQTNRDLSIALIADDRERGLALIAAEAEQISKRIDLTVLGAEERRAAEDSIAEYVLLRERQLTEQLKPESERQLELWEDYARRRIQVNEEVNRAFVDGGRDAFGNFLATGKLSVDSLGEYALRVLGEQLYERSGTGRAFAALGDAVFDGIDSLVSSVTGPGTSSVAAQPSAERDVLRQLEAAAASQISQLAASTAAETTNTSAVASDTASTVTHRAATDLATGSLAALRLAANAASAALSGVGGQSAGNSLSSLIGSWFGADGGSGAGIGLPGVGDGGGMGFPFAKGAAFDNGYVQAFARGGVFANTIVNEPTPFLFSRGGVPAQGVMGEAGQPEGIFPLMRDSRGRLGVSAQGAAAPAVQLNVEIVNNSRAEVRTEPTQGGGLRVLIDEVVSEVDRRLAGGGSTARAAAGRFGLNNGATLNKRRGGG
jgi:phage-related minor tail protein